MNSVEYAFSKIDRQNFVPEYLRDQAYLDAPLPIGYGQSISQPSTVKLILQWLDAKPNETVLDVGSGSGWTTALLSEIVKPNGKIFAVERIPELVKLGKDNCDRIGITNAKFFQSGKEYGLPQYAPFNRILVSAAASELPIELLDQLKANGKLIIPVEDDILEITKTTNNYKTIIHPGFIFVPLIGSDFKI